VETENMFSPNNSLGNFYLEKKISKGIFKFSQEKDFSK